jgi:hypothetical protein
MDEIELLRAVRPAAPEFPDREREQSRGLVLAAAAAGQPAAGPPAPAGRHRRRVWLVAVPVAAAVAVAAVAGVSARHPGQGAGTAGTRPAGYDPRALAFTTGDGFITVIVRDPLADQASYNAEFKAHGLDITLSLVPVSPSIVGTVVEISTSGPDGDSITTITARGRCQTGGGGDECPVGLRVPVGYRGQATLVFGRAARPGEQYESAAPATAPGEVMYGLTYQGKSVAAVLAMLRARDVTVPTYRYNGNVLAPDQVPGTWYVYNAVPWAAQQVLLFVGPTPNGAPVGSGRPVPRPARSSS